MFLEHERKERLRDGFTSELRFRLRTDDPNVVPEVMRDLASLMQEYEAVAHVHQDPEARVLVVRYDERRGAGEVLRGVLRDRLTAARPKVVPQAPRVSVVRAWPGCVRLRVEGGPPRAVEQLAVWIGQLAGVERARGSPASATVLVNYDAALTSAEAILARVQSAEPSEWPEVQPEPPTARGEWIKA